MNVEDLIFGVFALAVIFLFYFIAVAPLLRRRFLKKNGIALTAEIISATKTIFKKGSGTFAEPVWELKVSYTYQGTDYLVSKKHAISQSAAVPQPGSKLDVMINPQKPKDMLIL
jgi:hypothetical protein